MRNRQEVYKSGTLYCLLVSHAVFSDVGCPNLVCFLGEHILVCRHHIEASSEVGKSGAQVHLTFEFFVDFFMVEVGVGEEAVQAPHDIMQVLFGVLRDRHAIEVI